MPQDTQTQRDHTVIVDTGHNLVKYVANQMSGNVTYRVYNANNVEMLAVSVDQHADNGAYVRATDISANSNIDAVKFEYLGP